MQFNFSMYSLIGKPAKKKTAVLSRGGGKGRSIKGKKIPTANFRLPLREAANKYFFQ